MTTALAPAPAPAPADVEPELPREVQRTVRGRSFDDKMTLAFAACSSLALTWIAFHYVLLFGGLVGFTITWYLSVLAAYAALTAISHPRPIVVDRVASTLVSGAAAVLAAVLASAIIFVTVRGWSAVHHTNFVTKDMGGVRPTAPLTQGGIAHAIVGSLIELAIAISVTLPLGIGAAVFMTEVGGRLGRIVRGVVEAMTALPSIVAGLFIFTVLIVELHFQRSGFAAAMALAVMGLPIQARATDVVLRVVPGGLREASLALGASRWQTVWRVILPTARPGLATALILATARMVGETSPVLLTSGASTFFNKNPVNNPMNSLPLFIFESVRSGEPGAIVRGFGAGIVLLLIVLMLFVLARRTARHKGFSK
jgi:phosphate transport system permease protein